MTRTCDAPGCERKFYARGRCYRHYWRLWKAGRLDLAPRQTVGDRFWAKVDKNGPVPAHRPELGPCWVWAASLRGGYGQFALNGRVPKAHRVAWELTHGTLPEGDGKEDSVLVLHSCDNPACVNPGHLFLGTYGDNARDMSAKGRTRWRSKKQGPTREVVGPREH